MGDLTTGYLLGQMAERHFKEMEETAVAVMAPRRVVQPQIDVGGMLAENRVLRSENVCLQANVEILKRDLDRFEAWGRGLAAELAVLKGR